MAKKLATSNLPFSGVRGIHTNPKQKWFFKSREGFFRKSSFCTLDDLNHRFGGPWIFLINDSFIMLQKKDFLNFFKRSKVPYWQFFIFGKMALCTLAWNSELHTFHYRCHKFRHAKLPHSVLWNLVYDAQWYQIAKIRQKLN